MSLEKQLALRKVRRTFRVRNKIRGTQPRVSVFRSNKHISAQVIDDVAGKTLSSFSSVAFGTEKSANKDVAFKVGIELAKLAAQQGVTNIRFDRGSNLYHGRVKALADGLREGGLVF